MIRTADLVGARRPGSASTGANLEERLVHPFLVPLLEGERLVGECPHALLKLFASAGLERPHSLERLVGGEFVVLLRTGFRGSLGLAQHGELVRLG